MAEIYNILNIEKIVRACPHFTNTKNAKWLDFGRGGNYYGVNCRNEGFNHLRLIYSKNTDRYWLHLLHLKIAMLSFYGSGNIGMYTLPAESQVCFGESTEHLFLSPRTKSEYTNTLKNIFTQDHPVSGTYLSGQAPVRYYVTSYQDHMIIKTDQGCMFEFSDMMKIKHKLFGPEIPMVAPIVINSSTDTLIFYQNWAGRIPNLRDMYDYSKAPEKMPSLSEIINIKDLQFHQRIQVTRAG